MKRGVVLFSVVLLGCPTRSNIPNPRPLPTDTASCRTACDHLETLGCPEGSPLEDGTTCTKFCEDTQNSGHALNPSCVAEIKSCKEVETICAR
jgi:hypothetical protein